MDLFLVVVAAAANTTLTLVLDFRHVQLIKVYAGTRVEVFFSFENPSQRFKPCGKTRALECCCVTRITFLHPRRLPCWPRWRRKQVEQAGPTIASQQEAEFQISLLQPDGRSCCVRAYHGQLRIPKPCRSASSASSCGRSSGLPERSRPTPRSFEENRPRNRGEA